MAPVRALSAAFALFALASPAHAADTAHSFALLGGTADGVSFLDAKSITHKGSAATFWFLSVNPPGAEDSAYQTIQMQIDCKAQENTIIFVANYDEDGKPVDSSKGDGTKEKIVPGTFEETAEKFVCNGVDPYPNIEKLDSIESAIVGGRQLIGQMKMQEAPQEQSPPPAAKRPAPPPPDEDVPQRGI
jgi:hypothetical protein